MGECREQVFIEGVAFAVDALLFVHFVFEAFALFDGVSQFAEAVREFHAQNIKFEAFSDTRVVRAGPCKGCFHARVLIQNCRRLKPETRFDALD